MQISEPEVTAEVGPEVTRFRPRLLRSRGKGDSHRRSPLLLPDSRLRRHLGLLRRRIYFLLLAPGSESARLIRAF